MATAKAIYQESEKLTPKQYGEILESSISARELLELAHRKVGMVQWRIEGLAIALLNKRDSSKGKDKVRAEALMEKLKESFREYTKLVPERANPEKDGKMIVSSFGWGYAAHLGREKHGVITFGAMVATRRGEGRRTILISENYIGDLSISNSEREVLRFFRKQDMTRKENENEGGLYALIHQGHNKKEQKIERSV